MKKIAIPVDFEGMLDTHFGHCKYFALIKTHGQKILAEEIVIPPPHEPGLLPKWLAEKGVTDIVAGGMGQKAIELFNRQNVNAFVGAPKQSAKQLAQGLLSESLTLSANYCNH